MTAGARRVCARAPAKINLCLAVLGRRPDGFHELDSLFLALDLADTLAVERTGEPGVHLTLTGPAAEGVPAGEENLAVRGARAALARAGAAGGLRLELEKHVPSGAGLGGGSSDAAAALAASAELLGLDPDDAALRAELEALGSDCAFFLRARATGLARCTGRGERVEPLALAFPWTVVLLTPAFGCATAEVYRALAAGPYPSTGPTGPPGAPGATGPCAGREARALLALPLERLRGELANDLEAAALRSRPELAAIRAVLEGLEPGAFRLTGSGSSFFALCTDRAAGQALCARAEAALRGRRYALRGAWVLRARGRGIELAPSRSHFGTGPTP